MAGYICLFPKARFSSVMKEKHGFSQKMCFFPLPRGKTYFFLTLGPWCQDISWLFPLDDSNPCVGISLGSIPLSTLHVDYTSTLLTLAGSSHKKGPDALGTCPTTLSVIAVKLESLDECFPRNTPRSKIETWLYFFIGKKRFWIAKVQQKAEHKYRKNEQNHQKSVGIFSFSSF